MVNSIKHNSVETPAPSCEKVCPKCGQWTASQQVLYYSIFVQEIFLQRMFLNRPAQPSPAIEQKGTGRSCVLATAFCYDIDAPVTVQAYDGCLPNAGKFALWSPSLLIKLLPATLETQTRCLRTVTIAILAPLPASAQIRSIPSSTSRHKFKQDKSAVYLFSDVIILGGHWRRTARMWVNENNTSDHGLSVSLLHNVSEGNHQIFKPNFESSTPKIWVFLCSGCSFHFQQESTTSTPFSILGPAGIVGNKLLLHIPLAHSSNRRHNSVFKGNYSSNVYLKKTKHWVKTA